VLYGGCLCSGGAGTVKYHSQLFVLVLFTEQTNLHILPERYHKKSGLHILRLSGHNHLGGKRTNKRHFSHFHSLNKQTSISSASTVPTILGRDNGHEAQKSKLKGECNDGKRFYFLKRLFCTKNSEKQKIGKS
jgi:hypothetical protein